MIVHLLVAYSVECDDVSVDNVYLFMRIHAVFGKTCLIFEGAERRNMLPATLANPISWT
jgi:hypothetical protein